MVVPQTPKKVDDVITQYQLRLETSCGLHFPPREAFQSPAKRDRSSSAERVCTLLNTLRFKDPEGLRETVEAFEESAPTVVAKWNYKPLAEAGVVPSRPAMNSPMRQDFLRQKWRLSEHESEKLMQALEKRLRARLEKLLREHMAESSTLQVSAAQFLRTGQDASQDLPFRRQSSRLLSKRRPLTEIRQKASVSEFESQVSSGNFPEDHINQILANVPDLGPYEMRQDPDARASSDSPIHEQFKTPPESPPRKAAESPLFQMPCSPVKKRVHQGNNETLRPPKIAKDGFPGLFANEVSNSSYSLNDRHIGPSMRQDSSSNSMNKGDDAANSSWLSKRLSNSAFPSFSTVASATNTPNTSFSISSSKASFDSAAEDTDATVKARQAPRGRDHSRSVIKQADTSGDVVEVDLDGSLADISPVDDYMEVDDPLHNAKEDIEARLQAKDPMSSMDDPLGTMQTNKAMLKRLRDHSPFCKQTKPLTCSH